MRKLLLICLILFTWILTDAQNNPPVAVSDTVTVTAEDWIDIQVLLNDYDLDGDDFFINTVKNPEHGEKEYNDSIASYRSDYYVGPDSMRYRIRDNGLPPENSEYAYIYIDVQENPNLPFAQDDSLTTLSQFAATFDVMVNDMDPNGDQIIINEITNNPNHGVAFLIGDSLIQYKSDVGYTGTDYLEYTVIEKNTANQYFSNEAIVKITIEENPDLPVAVEDLATTITFIPIDINVLTNDYDPNGDELMVSDVNSSPNCSVEIISDSIIRYRSEYIVGKDTITYRIKEKNSGNGYVSDWAMVIITVNENPDVPVAVTDNAELLSFQTIEINALANDYDPQGDPIEIWQVEKGQFDEITFNDSIITYTSWSPYLGIHEFNYRIREKNDTTIYSDWATVQINISQNPEYPQTVNDYASTTAGIPVTIDLIANDINPANDTLVLANIFGNTGGLIEKVSDSLLKYTPWFNFSGIDSVKYMIRKKNEPFPLSVGYLIVEVQSNQSYATLDANNIGAGINSFGYLFNNFNYIPGFGVNNFKASFEAPIGSGKHSIFSSTLWIGGLDANGYDSLHFAGERYKQIGDDYWAGPVSDTYDEDYDLKWSRLWKIDVDQINHHIHHFQDPGYSPIDVIQNWPGNGDVAQGQLEKLAPFYDSNQNGTYEPMDGDYPLIRGTQAIYFIYNDDRDFHSESSGKKLGVEIHGMAYVFDEPGDSALWNSVFLHYDIFNRSDTTYTETYTGNFTDFDIGYAQNDYVICDVQRGAFIGYNGTDYDPDYEEVLGYHYDLPAQAMVMLGGPYMDEDLQDNPSGGCNESINGLNFGNGVVDDERFGLTRFVKFNNNSTAIGDPDIAPEYYYMLKGYWKDLAPVSYGGNGHIDFGAVGPECNFMFPGDSDTCNWGTGGIYPNGGYNQNGLYWTEEEAGNAPFDIRGLSVSGPVTFEPGDKQEMDVVYVFAQNYTKDDPIELLLERIDDLKEKVVEEELIELPETLGIQNTGSEKFNLKVYPNPVDKDRLYVDCGIDFKELTYKIIDISGYIIKQGKVTGASKFSVDVSKLSDGLFILQVYTDESSEYIKFIKQ